MIIRTLTRQWGSAAAWSTACTGAGADDGTGAGMDNVHAGSDAWVGADLFTVSATNSGNLLAGPQTYLNCPV